MSRHGVTAGRNLANNSEFGDVMVTLWWRSRGKNNTGTPYATENRSPGGLAPPAVPPATAQLMNTPSDSD